MGKKWISLYYSILNLSELKIMFELWFSLIHTILCWLLIEWRDAFRLISVSSFQAATFLLLFLSFLSQSFSPGTKSVFEMRISHLEFIWLFGTRPCLAREALLILLNPLGLKTIFLSRLGSKLYSVTWRTDLWLLNGKCPASIDTRSF